MGILLSRVGSDPYYASYERSFEHLKVDSDKLKAKALQRQQRRHNISSTIFWYSCAVYAAIFAYTVWVCKQPPGTFSVQGHIKRVSPVFLFPGAAYVLHQAVVWLTSWQDRRDAKHLKTLDQKQKKLLAELKDSTRYEKTLVLLKKYDPEYVQHQAAEAARRASPVNAPPLVQPGALSRPADAGMKSPRLGGLGRNILPALDRLAGSLIGDNPALIEGLREARGEAEALRRRLAAAEAQAVALQAQNWELRVRLGEADPVDVAPPPAQLLSPPLSPTSSSPILGLVSAPCREAAAGDGSMHGQEPLKKSPASAAGLQAAAAAPAAPAAAPAAAPRDGMGSPSKVEESKQAASGIEDTQARPPTAAIPSTMQHSSLSADAASYQQQPPGGDSDEDFELVHHRRDERDKAA